VFTARYGLITYIRFAFKRLNSVTLSPQHVKNFSRALEMMQCKEQNRFAGTKCFLKAEPVFKLSRGQDSTGNRTFSI
jgi:hypothetical protein